MISRLYSGSASSPADGSSRIDCRDRSSALAVCGIDACSKIINESFFRVFRGRRCGDAIGSEAGALEVPAGTVGIAEVVAVAIGASNWLVVVRMMWNEEKLRAPGSRYLYVRRPLCWRHDERSSR